MKRKLSLLCAGLIVLGTGLTVVNEGSKSEAETRTSLQTREGKILLPSGVEQKRETQEVINNSEIKTKFKDESYAFSLNLEFAEFEKNVAYKDEQAANEHLRSATDYLNELTNNGTDFSAAAWLQKNENWTLFVEDIARLKYQDFDNSEVLNDLDVAGALILQVERYYDEPSLRYLYQVISDLNSGIRNESVKFGVTMSFGEENQFQEIHKYLQSKI